MRSLGEFCFLPLPAVLCEQYRHSSAQFNFAHLGLGQSEAVQHPSYSWTMILQWFPTSLTSCSNRTGV